MIGHGQKVLLLFVDSRRARGVAPSLAFTWKEDTVSASGLPFKRIDDERSSTANPHGSLSGFLGANDPCSVGLPRHPDGFHLVRSGSDLHSRHQIRKTETDA